MTPGVYEIKVTPVKLKSNPQTITLTGEEGERVEKKLVFESFE